MNVRTSRHGVARALALALVATLALPAASASGRTLPPVDRAATAADTTAASPRTALVALRASAADVQLDPRYDVPTFLWGAQAASALRALDRAPTAKAGLDAEAAARAYLHDLADVYRTTAGEIDALPLHSVSKLADGAAIVRLTGNVAGTEVFREQFNVLLARDGTLVSIGGFALGAPASLRKRAQDDAPAAASTAAAALRDFEFPATVAQRWIAQAGEGGYTLLALPEGVAGDTGATLARPVRVRPVWFRLGPDLLAAHYVEVAVRDGANRRHVDHYAYVIADDDGAVLFRKSQVAHAAYSYRVLAESAAPYLPLPGPGGRGGFPHPTGTPNGYQPPFVAQNLVTLQNLPFSRNDPWLPDNATKTIGNNVEAYADLFEPELLGPVDANECNLGMAVTGDFHACTTSANAFDHVADFTKDANTSRGQIMAGVTQLFYLVNYFHDWYYDAGFDEISGNAQNNNFGRGGLGNDAVVAIAQDYSDFGNAYMVTPADGQHPELHNFLWETGATLSKVLAPPAIAGVKAFGAADFGAASFDQSGSVVAALDAANGTGPTTTDGCTPITNAAAIAGKIALIDRGTCTFVVKAKNAQLAGAAAVLIANNVAGGLTMTGDDATFTLPIVSVNLADGNAIKAQLAAGTPVTMRLARAQGTLRDGAIDTLVIAHEWGHYISTRLVANGNGLDNNQGGGMGEGWADFHQMLLLVKDADRTQPANANFGGTYASNAFLLGGPDFAPDSVNNAYYYGDRRYPYTRDLTKNPLTLRHISDGVPLPPAPVPSLLYASPDNSEVHNTGEIWGSLLWECYSNLLNDTSRLTFAQAQDRMKRYLVAGYKVTPANPTFVTARDALLSVMKAQDGADHDLCLAGFAKRGAGLGAVAPGAFSLDHSGVVESYKAVKPAGGAKRAAIEYYNAGFDHYFMTDIPDEIAKLDNGTFVGWARTGLSFPVYSDYPAGSMGVCRFFSTSFTPRSSHFYTSDPNECAGVKRNPDWQFEGVVFGLMAPGPAGDCPAGTQAIYRLYNNGQGAAPNHRYTTSEAIRTQMIGKGWIPEGYGALGVIMCSPS